MKTIHLLRHGQIDGPAALYGKTDVALSSEGFGQLERATRQLSKPDCIVSSPLIRCQKFAQMQAAEMGCELIVDTDLREMDFGLWDGVPYSQHSPHWPAMTDFWHSPADTTPPEGEALQTMNSRTHAAWLRLLEIPAQEFWVISHGGAIRLLLARILNLDWRNPQLYSTLAVDYASRTTLNVSYFENKPTVRVQAISIPPPSQ